MKKFSLILAMFTAIVAITVPFAGCNSSNKLFTGNNKPSPSNSLVPVATKLPIGSLSPIMVVDLTKKLNEKGIPVCKVTALDLGFQATLRSPVFHVSNDTSDFNNVIDPIARITDSNYIIDVFVEFTEEHFKDYFVVTLNVPFGTGSNKLVFNTARTENGVTKLYFSIHRSGDVGTAVMTSAFTAVSLDRLTFNASNPVEVYIDNSLISTDNGEIK